MSLKSAFPLILGSLLLLLLGSEGCQQAPQQKIPELEVPVVEVIRKDVPIIKEFVGQVYGKVDIPIRARVEGFLDGIHFDEGRKVNKGQLLYSIDPQPFQAEVARRKSEVAQAKINAVKAMNDLVRIEPLAEIKAVSQSDLDAARAEKDAADAAVEAAEAGLRMAEIELSYTRIKSPISGLIGKTQAKVGEFVGRSPNPVILNTVSRLDSVRVEFFLTERDYLMLAKRFLTDESSGNEPSGPREDRHLQLLLADGTIFPFPGIVDFIDRQVDPNTGSLLVQATFPNPSRLIRPGQFAKVRAQIEEVPGALLVPQRCIREFQGQYSVFIVNDSSQVVLRSVILGPKYQDFWLVESGLEEGNKIVLEGLQKVREGATVKPVIQTFNSQYKAGE